MCAKIYVLSTVGLKLNCTVACAETCASSKTLPVIFIRVFHISEGVMKHNSKRWNDQAAIGSYNPLAYSKRVLHDIIRPK